MKFTQATVEKLKQFAEQQRKELKEITKKLDFWEKQTTVLGVRLDEARENSYSLQHKADVIQGSLAICKVIFEAENNAE